MMISDDLLLLENYRSLALQLEDREAAALANNGFYCLHRRLGFGCAIRLSWAGLLPNHRELSHCFTSSQAKKSLAPQL
jgi:hypothetical protein